MSRHEFALMGNQPPTIGALEERRLASYSQRAAGVSWETVLSEAAGQERFFWQDPAGGFSLAGFGAATEIVAWGKGRFEAVEAAAARLFAEATALGPAPALAEPRLFGGFAFSDDFAPDNTWAYFSPAHFVLPHYQLVWTASEAWLTINVMVSPDEKLEEVRSQLEQASSVRLRLLQQAQKAKRPDAVRPRLAAMTFPMPYAIWAERIEEALAEMHQGRLLKVVLARVCEVRLDDKAEVVAALRFLDAAYASCYRFLFEPLPYHAFFGATPELLAQVSHGDMRSMALAGSIQRGQTAAEDEQFRRRLMADGKERFEHAVVVDSLRRRLEPLVERLEAPAAPAVMSLGNIHHLLTPISGRLRQDGGILPIVAALHPTPALGGSPRQQAMAFIEGAEPVPRGWYAGPVGWIDQNLDGAFAVAIRSAVTQRERVWLYAGAGIVSESMADKEWRETALKLQPMLEALGVPASPPGEEAIGHG